MAEHIRVVNNILKQKEVSIKDTYTLQNYNKTHHKYQFELQFYKLKKLSTNIAYIFSFSMLSEVTYKYMKYTDSCLLLSILFLKLCKT